MAVDMNLVKLAVDTYKGCPEKYSVKESSDALRQALIELNGGTELNYKKMRAGASNGLFELIEEIITRVTVEGLQASDSFNALVDIRNVAEGDEAVFDVQDENWYEVSTMAHGQRGLRRQRVHGVEQKAIKTELHGVRIYEPLRRILAGRVDFNQFIADVSKSMSQKILEDVYAIYAGLSQADLGSAYFPNVGTYDEAKLLDVIQHVEAASGSKAIIMGTPKALRQLTPSIVGVEAKSDLYNIGWVGKLGYGNDVIATPQRHKVGTTQFILPDDTIYVIGTNGKPIKFVYEGDTIIKQTDALDNADMTQEYEIYSGWGTGFVSAGDAIGKYQFT